MFRREELVRISALTPLLVGLGNSDGRFGRAGLRLGFPNHPVAAPAEDESGEEDGEASTKLG